MNKNESCLQKIIFILSTLALILVVIAFFVKSLHIYVRLLLSIVFFLEAYSNYKFIKRDNMTVVYIIAGLFFLFAFISKLI